MNRLFCFSLNANPLKYKCYFEIKKTKVYKLLHLTEEKIRKKTLNNEINSIILTRDNIL